MRYRYILGRQQARRRKGKPGPLFTRPVENAQQIVTRWKRTSNRDSAAARKERVWVRGGKKAVAKENGESKWVNKREWNEVIHQQQQQTNDSLISISASIHFLFFPPSAQLSPQFHDGLRSLSCCFTYQTLIDLYRERERRTEICVSFFRCWRFGTCQFILRFFPFRRHEPAGCFAIQTFEYFSVDWILTKTRASGYHRVRFHLIFLYEILKVSLFPST